MTLKFITKRIVEADSIFDIKVILCDFVTYLEEQKEED